MTRRQPAAGRKGEKAAAPPISPSPPQPPAPVAHLDLDLDTDIDMDVDVVGSAWGSRPGGQWHHSYDSCGPTTIRAWFFLLHLLNPPAPVAHLDMDVDGDVDIDTRWLRRGALQEGCVLYVWKRRGATGVGRWASTRRTVNSGHWFLILISASACLTTCNAGCVGSCVDVASRQLSGSSKNNRSKRLAWSSGGLR